MVDLGLWGSDAYRVPLDESPDDDPADGGAKT
jgi:hypothetical protein